MYIIHHIQTYAQHKCNNKRTTGGGFVTSRWKSSKLIRREGCYVTTGQMTQQLSMVKMVVMMTTPDGDDDDDGDDGGDDDYSEARLPPGYNTRLQHQMVMTRTVAVKTMNLGAPPLFHDVTTQDGNEAGTLDFFYKTRNVYF